MLKNQEDIDLFSARDALVLKALSLVLGPRLSISKCTHVKGHGGGKGAVRQVLRHLPHHRFVLRTDVQSYYASIDHELLLDHLSVAIKDTSVLNLIGQYLKRCAERDGLYWEYSKGIALGSPLSPIIGAFFLKVLDERMERLGLYVKRWLRWVNAGIREDGMVLVLRDTGVLPVFPAPPKEAQSRQTRAE